MNIFRHWTVLACIFIIGSEDLPHCIAQETTLKQAVGNRYKIGVGVSDNIPDREKDWALLTSQFSIVTPENSMKTQSIQPAEGTFQFDVPDRFVAFAKSKNLEVVGHCLVWAKDDRTSEWWHKDGDVPTSKDKLFERMKSHIDTVVRRYANDVTMWDVVNEALEDGQTGYLRDSIWTRTSGEEFMVKAFQYARENDPDALLIYNDYNSEYPGKREKTIKLLKSLLEQGAPIDAFGMQGHFELDTIQFDNLELLFNDLRALKLKVVVSELDIDVVPRSRWWADGGKYRDEMSTINPYKDGCPPEILQKQADQYAQLFRLFKKHEDIIARVSFWNLHDGESWLNYFPWNRVNHPLLFDRDGQPKPAFQAVVDAIAKADNPQQQQAIATEPVVFTTQQDHQNMLQQLGITKLRNGRSGDEKSPNSANYDEAKANPYPDLPEVLTTGDGALVESKEAWWNKRRPEIVQLLEREVYGRIPANVPSVKWEVRETREIEAGGKAAIQKHIVGVVDNSACPEIVVNISMSLTLPKDVDGPVPVLMTFGWTPFDPNPFAGRTARGGPATPKGARSASREDKLIKAGWGCATINPSTVQADAGGFQRSPFGGNANANEVPRGAGLTRGIIGLTNLGQPRKPDDWGALRAWGWGASRALDYMESEANVDAKKVAIAGVSRYGKAALVTMAFDERFGMGLLASSGAGGTKIIRRNFGESLENLASAGEYHWMAGNYIKYAAEESRFGSKTANDLPVDAHMALALCAPRLTFISHGIPERGDANWLDHQGSFMAAIAAQPVFRLLGAKDLGRSDDYKTEKMPAVNVGMLDGELAWRQHNGGHTDEPNIEHFIKWANRLYGRPTVDLGLVPPQVPLAAPSLPRVKPIERNDPNSALAHQQLVAKAKQGKIDVYFVGDSITRRWGATDYPDFLANWKRNFHGWNAANFGWGGDTTNNILWRMQNGELQGVAPKVFVLQGGTNNLPWTGAADESKIEEIVMSIQSILRLLREKSPNATIVLTAIFPRPQNPALASSIEQINKQLEMVADGKSIRFVNINSRLVDSSGNLLPGMSEDGLHLTEESYQVWADALKPIFQEILGPPSAEDQSRPATGDPRAQEAAVRTEAN